LLDEVHFAISSPIKASSLSNSSIVLML